MPRNLTLGIEAEDVVTKFKGILTGKASYLTGCDQYLVSPDVGKDGKARGALWFDESRLKVTTSTPVELATPNDPEKGADIEAPGGTRGGPTASRSSEAPVR